MLICKGLNAVSLVKPTGVELLNFFCSGIHGCTVEALILFYLSFIYLYFSVTSIALNDVSVREGNILKPFAREIGTSQKFASLLQIKGK